MKHLQHHLASYSRYWLLDCRMNTFFIKESYFPVIILKTSIMSPLILLNLRVGRLRILSLSSYDGVAVVEQKSFQLRRKCPETKKFRGWVAEWLTRYINGHVFLQILQVHPANFIPARISITIFHKKTVLSEGNRDAAAVRCVLKRYCRFSRLLRGATPPPFHPTFGGVPLDQIAGVRAPRSEYPN